MSGIQGYNGRDNGITGQHYHLFSNGDRNRRLYGYSSSNHHGIGYAVAVCYNGRADNLRFCGWLYQFDGNTIGLLYVPVEQWRHYRRYFKCGCRYLFGNSYKYFPDVQQEHR
jgi:hypothetical protein